MKNQAQGRPLFNPQLSPETNYNGDNRIGRKLYDINKNKESKGFPSQDRNIFNVPNSQSSPNLQSQQFQPQLNFSKSPNYAKELFELQERLKKKNEELQSYQRLKDASPTIAENKSKLGVLEIYNRINKGMYDKVQKAEQVRDHSQSLDYQVSQKERVKQIEILEKESDLTRRLEDLQRRRVEEIQSRVEKYNKAKEYREHLEMQAGIRETIKKEEIHDMKSNLPIPVEMPPKTNYSNMTSPSHIDNQFQQNVLSFYDTDSQSTVSNPYFTKKKQRTIFFNPITGSLQDTSNLIYGPPSLQKIIRPDNPILPTFKNKSRIAVDLADLPAFQQPKYTKNSPKIVPTFPIIGSANPIVHQNDFKESAAKFFGVDEKMVKNLNDKGMINYGNFIIQNR